MNRVVSFVVAVARELWSLVVDDGLLAVAALVSIGIVYVASRESVLGPTAEVGWLLIVLVVASLVASVRRAVRQSRR